MIKDYNPTGVKETDLVDPHGNKGYNVFFENEDKPVFMMAKRAPEVGNVEYGEIVDTPKKSGEGTYRKFVRKQREEAPEQPKPAEGGVPATPSYGSRDDSMYRCNALNNATALFAAGKIEDPIIMADDFMAWLRNEPKISEEVPLPEHQGEEDEINIDEIDF